MVWELSSWYHTLDLGFRTRIVGETDFPCITDLRVGQARSYVSDGRTHLMDFEIDGVKAGTPGSEVALAGPETIRAKVRAAALLNAAPDAGMKGRPYDQRPYWSIERARAGNSQEVNVELVMNGEVIASKPIRADGTVQDVTFDVTIERSSWVAVRILAAAHSNPMFVLVGGQADSRLQRQRAMGLDGGSPVLVAESAAYITGETPAARAAYDHAEASYKQFATECASH